MWNFLPRSSDDDIDGSEYIVLENLTECYKKPCVLDLKMGTRMYGDFATETKRESQRRKCQKSTSAKLGVRFGFINFDIDTHSAQCLRKVPLPYLVIFHYTTYMLSYENTLFEASFLEVLY